MPRSYRHISVYENEIRELRKQGKSRKEICELLGISQKQLHNFITRYNKKQRMIESGQGIHKKGRPSKSDNGIPPSIQRLYKLAQMRYVMASKDRHIKQLEMENELMRDFLSHTERK